MQALGKMNIGFFVETHQPGVGLFDVIDSIARHLIHSANVTVFTTSLKDKKQVDDYPYHVARHHIIRFPFLNIQLPLRFLDFKFNRLLKDAKLDIVHIHSGHTMGMIGIQHAKERNIPVIGTLHGLVNLNAWNPSTEKNHTDKDIEEIKNAYHSCKLIFSNQSLKESVLALDEQFKKPVILPMGTDLMTLNQETMVLELRQKHMIKTDEKILLSVHSMHVPSNSEWIADALFKLRLKGYKFRWIILNAASDALPLTTHIRKNGLSPYVLMVKPSSSTEYAAYLKMSDLMLHAALLDPFNTMLIEAASQKKPVLCIEESPITRHITDGINGFLSKQAPTVFAEKITELLKFPKVIQKVGEKAYQDFYRPWTDVALLHMEAYNQATLNHKQTS